jgi:hypothetical protein
MICLVCVVRKTNVGNFASNGPVSNSRSFNKEVFVSYVKL